MNLLGRWFNSNKLHESEKKSLNAVLGIVNNETCRILKMQIENIHQIQRILKNQEIDFYYKDQVNSPPLLTVRDTGQEFKLAEITWFNANKMKSNYKTQVWLVNGRLFSLNSNFNLHDNLEIDSIKLMTEAKKGIQTVSFDLAGLSKMFSISSDKFSMLSKGLSSFQEDGPPISMHNGFQLPQLYNRIIQYSNGFELGTGKINGLQETIEIQMLEGFYLILAKHRYDDFPVISCDENGELFVISDEESIEKCSADFVRVFKMLFLKDRGDSFETGS